MEAMPFFVRNDAALRFDPTDEKLGNLGSLRPGDRGLQGRVALSHAINNVWDARVSASMLYSGKDERSASHLTSSSASAASQSARSMTGDLEVGYRPPSSDAFELRIFAGARALRSTGNAHWQADDKLGQKLGAFDDRTQAFGPRIGAEMTLPVAARIDIVGTGAVSVLMAESRSRYRQGVTVSTERDKRWVVGADAMAGVALDLGDGAKLTLGYRVEHWRNLAAQHTDVDNAGARQTGWGAPTLSHGPLMRLSLPLGGR